MLSDVIKKQFLITISTNLTHRNMLGEIRMFSMCSRGSYMTAVESCNWQKLSNQMFD